MSYKLNAFSVFYVGMHIGAKNREAVYRERLTRDEQTVYAKMQYLLHL